MTFDAVVRFSKAPALKWAFNYLSVATMNPIGLLDHWIFVGETL
jgi:hypothetical protein